MKKNNCIDKNFDMYNKQELDFLLGGELLEEVKHSQNKAKSEE